ncbi:MFS transporter [Gammaproteobacteria bacterium]|jgi:ACS family sodium-dependent inorganic phosphate cotransporter|nr:MFS transporter [Gammaproteobacteria bacterium]MDA8955444.1 MFS transporter [Gammaproteobacteria bacterium]MDA9039715.1 MFS transporter [Gammaproteobacteria bacterium]MDA9102286.1 MFS transporter [Gammaproteobacteria bacterium]|tara:strand:- start:76 stop:1317 length:1242 start_codon:yes stop_codon:yes gene_type:complete
MSFLAVFICFIDRVNISVAIIPMQAQFGWSESQVGIILGSFYIGYIISMTFSGFLADKYGGKIVLAYGLLFWSFFTLITPAFAYSGYFFLILIRILMGLGEGVTFPAWHSIYARWIPFQERTRAIAITNSGISFGSVFGLVVTAMIIDGYSWEWVFYSFGVLGILLFFFWQKVVTSYPEDHKSISNEELEYIKAEAPTNSAAPSIPFLEVIKNGPFIAIVVATFCNNWALFTFLSYLPKFMSSSTEIGGLGLELGSSLFILLILVPSVVSVFALILGGISADMLIKRGYKTIKVRKFFNSLGFFGAALFLFLLPFQSSILLVITLLCLTNLCSGLGAGGYGVNHADLGPKYTGSLFGISGSLGMIAAVLSPIVAGIILQATNSWTLIFHICSGFLVIGGIYYFLFASADKQFD